METDQNTDDLQRQVLQSTLDEVATRQEDATDCCVICLESISEACEAVPCQHRNFDYLCLLSWLQQSPKCPLCKAVISQVRYGLDEPVAKTYTVPEPAPEPRAPHIEHPRLPPHLRPRRRHVHHRLYPPQPRYVTVSSSPSDEIAKRRDVYRHNRYSKHVGSNRVSRYRELTPSAFCSDSDLVSRARMWIRRELQVFSFLNPDADQTEPRPDGNSQRDEISRRRANNAEFLLEYIIAILKSVDIMGSAGQAEEMISDFLGRDSTRVFLHELRAWLRSPYTKLEDWDRAVQYDLSAPSSPRSESGGIGSSGQAQCQSKNVGARNWDTPRRQGDLYRPGGRSQRARGVHRREPYGRPHRD
ncbi:RING finger domain-containing protein [Fusarium pseudocircinatum]|uniref:RING-type E3 ubiquitin transferase n=1 Tax=Fusarium pseudocircinatum TaxID=56676 RepID=A0A8H5LB18_9HYPO|nr:RING finger domain-containing protein [Fusarium pseudocircinatum]